MCAALKAAPGLVLVAEPGAGKTTRVPPALAAAGLAAAGEILVLEPRRLAARLAARRVAAELGEPVGERVGYQMRFEEVAGPRTRIRFVTEGILTRRLVADPMLAGVSVVVLDEFHERHLHADVALALLRRLQQQHRPELRLLVMSATLDAEAVARFLGGPVLRVAGRTFPVAIEYRDPPSAKFQSPPLEEQVAAAVRRLVGGGPQGQGSDQDQGQAQASSGGDVLVFLPGAAEIRRSEAACQAVAAAAGLDVVMLHGDLPVEEQERAVRPGARPKLILATNVAETSITIEGVTAVVDSGLARVARHNPWSGLPSLDTLRISQAAAAQRAGRAGRMRPGRCLRLYAQHDFAQRPAFETPEIRRVDLAETVLALRHAGVRDLSGQGDPGGFAWFEAPPAAALEAAERVLGRLGALDERGQVTELGRRLLELPLHPRLGRLVLEAAARGAAEAGCLAAALLGEREIRLALRTSLGAEAKGGRAGGGPGHRRGQGPAVIDASGASDLVERLEAFRQATAGGPLRPERARAHGLDVGAAMAVARARDQIARALGRSATRGGARRSGGAATADAEALAEEQSLGLAALAAFPDRVARRRTRHAPELLLAGGGSARLAETSVVREAEWLVALDAEERREGGPVVRLASAIAPEWLVDLFPERLVERHEARFEREGERVELVSTLEYDGLVLAATRPADQTGPEVARALAEAALAAGLSQFADPEALARLSARVEFVAAQGFDLPRLDPAAVRETLVSLCEGRRSFAELRAADLPAALRARLSPPQQALLERTAPERVTLPGGRRVRVEYEPDKPPWIASRLQDFFGMAEGPRVAEGRVPLVLHLLAPNQRAVQVTTDLAGFWERHYPSIRKELMRRYPRHAWPEDPRRAQPPTR
ncbi:MAG TPA: ATP-dependent helicase C-terminal domain-containing protein [Polyangia bacterium]|nr:ATP-dependent helicase C-terminal domain-containing protein [Polyangia bacterium]